MVFLLEDVEFCIFCILLNKFFMDVVLVLFDIVGVVVVVEVVGDGVVFILIIFLVFLEFNLVYFVLVKRFLRVGVFLDILFIKFLSEFFILLFIIKDFLFSRFIGVLLNVGLFLLLKMFMLLE